MIPAALVAGAVLSLVIGMTLIVIAPRPEIVPLGIRTSDVIPYLFQQAAIIAVAGVLALRIPKSGVTWCISALSLSSALQFTFAGYGLYAPFRPDLAGATFAAWLYAWTGTSLAFLTAVLAAIFPDGRLASVRARAGVGFSFAATTLAALVLALRPGRLPSIPVENPFGWRDGAEVLDALSVAGILGIGVALVFLLLTISDRYRRGSAVERQQIKWFGWSIAVVAPVALAATPVILAPADPTGASDGIRYLARILSALAISLPPIAIAIAITRYRLYDIDLVIRRTIVYAVLSALVALTYGALVVVFQAALRPLIGGSEVAVAASTLATLALVQPLRRRIQSAVDRRFYRSRYDAARTLDGFVSRMRNEVDIEAVRDDFLGVVRDTLQPAHASVWLREASVTISGRVANRKLRR